MQHLIEKMKDHGSENVQRLIEALRLDQGNDAIADQEVHLKKRHRISEVLRMPLVVCLGAFIGLLIAFLVFPYLMKDSPVTGAVVTFLFFGFILSMCIGQEVLDKSELLRYVKPISEDGFRCKRALDAANGSPLARAWAQAVIERREFLRVADQMIMDDLFHIDSIERSREEYRQACQELHGITSPA